MLRFLLLALCLAVAAPPVYGGDETYRIGAGDSRLDPLGGALQFGIPKPVSLSAEELVVEVPFRVKSVGVSGRIERIDFRDLRLNGIPFHVDPYAAAFDLPDEDEPIVFPEPLVLRLRFAEVAPGIAREALVPSETLRLTGAVTVTGEYRKWIFSLRRAVEVPIDVTGPNPIAEYHPLQLLPEINLKTLRVPSWPF